MTECFSSEGLKADCRQSWEVAGVNCISLNAGEEGLGAGGGNQSLGDIEGCTLPFAANRTK